MMKKKSGFTLAEVLTTLMVIGVVAAMTIPTLMNSTDDQQNKVAYKKAMSVLSQGIQMLTAQENECWEELNGVPANEKAEGLAACMSSIMSGSLNGDEITTLDGMVYKFFVNETDSNATTIEELCGQVPYNSEDGWKGAGSCGVIVDTNGKSKGTKDFTNVPTFAANGFSAQPAQKDMLSLTLSANGVRPTYFTNGTNKGYEYMYGTKADDNEKPYDGAKMCYQCNGGVIKAKQIPESSDCESPWQSTFPNDCKSEQQNTSNN